MDVLALFSKFRDQEACIEHLENVRWRGVPACPKCRSTKVDRKEDGDRVGRWNCRQCRSSFNVLSGTIFQKTKVPLQKWFLAIGLMVHFKERLTTDQLARDLDLTLQTALFMQDRIRSELASEEGASLLRGITDGHEPDGGKNP